MLRCCNNVCHNDTLYTITYVIMLTCYIKICILFFLLTHAQSSINLIISCQCRFIPQLTAYSSALLHVCFCSPSPSSRHHSLLMPLHLFAHTHPTPFSLDRFLSVAEDLSRVRCREDKTSSWGHWAAAAAAAWSQYISMLQEFQQNSKNRQPCSWCRRQRHGQAWNILDLHLQ